MHLRCCATPTHDSDADIRLAVRRMLDACDVYEPPTPLDRLLSYRSLTTEAREALDVDRIIPRAIRAALGRIKGRVRGILDVRARHIYVDETLHQHRRTFLHHHEIGHDVLDWHRDLFVVTPEWALQPDQKKRFEAEANHFAALSMFQVDDFSRWQRGRRLDLEHLGELAARYGASLTATARQYVVEQDTPVALLLGKPDLGPDGRLKVRLYLGLANRPYLARFPSSLFGKEFSADDASASVLQENGPAVARYEVDLADINGEVRRLSVETIFNRYDTLTLVHPQANKRKVFGWLSSISRLQASA